ncbi:hypothetical protein A1O1_05013 [Capronia coronata CBS 617.96]|uniref:Xylanolytic transcriptional activator regulatory domain-containing protein n=1 Tax=Capronia coronata CBS 617.96 TaxID=1182541 RepID=W9YEI9_9EURO|nr:uncharacterized protein A1O1_05013 [Capronia coronata CBS 617.96]EXJ88085.1 hypothetical protein A1O1_05013 [Capronia coronata CBS 617.96]
MPVRSAGMISAQTRTQSDEQLEQPAQSAASTTHTTIRSKGSILDHQGPRGGHPPRPWATGATATEIAETPTATATTAQSSTSVMNPDSLTCSGMRYPSSSLPHRSIDPDSLAASDSRLSDLLQRVQRLENSSSTMGRTGDSVDSLASSLPTRSQTSWEDSLARNAHSRFQVRPPEWQVVLNKPRDLGRNGRMGEAPDFAAIISCYSAIVGKESQKFPAHEPEIAAQYAEAGELMLKCKNIARRLKMDRPSRDLPPVSPDPGFRLHLVPSSRAVADAMAKLYFQCFESTHRILHVPTFWADYQRYWDHPEAVTNQLRFKVLLVIAIGSSLYDHGDSNTALRNMEMVRPWIYAAEAWLAGPLEKDRLDIGGLQIYCLSIIARQIFSVGGDLVWISMGSLIHRAMQIGLHRDPKHLPSVPLLQSELRRRLWATILDLVVQASLDAWMPPRISFDEFDTEPPSNVNDDEMDESTLEIMPHPRTTFTTTSTQLALLDSLPVRLRIVQLLNGPHSEPSYSGVLAISSELTEALQKCSSLGMMKAKDQDQGPSHTMNHDQEAMPCPTPFHRSLLDYLVRRFMIPLHYFFSNQARSNPLFHYSLKLSLDAALALISPEPDPDGTFSRLMATGGGLFREGLRCAITAISLELLAHVGAQQQNGTLHRAPQHRELIKGAVRDLIALSEERIRHGETNVKSHMFLSMSLAQVEAVEAGVDIKLPIARSATESLRFCHEILSARAEASLPVEESEFVGAVEGMDGATPGSMGFEDYGMDWDWESFLPNAGFS